MAIQVYEATKDGQGNPLSVLSRQFISFSYGGKNIEDFGFVAAFTNDRLSKTVYAEFEDTTTNQTELDGQIFWMAAYKANTLSFSLATDGITEKELNNFNAWFIPGTPRELILTEHANRAIMARVSAAPSMSLLPFEEEIEIDVAGQKIKTRTSLYKGEMSLSFVMDNPHWYAIESCFSGDVSEEQAKVIYEDNIPHISMLTKETLLANNQYYNEETISAASGLTINGSNDMEQADTNLFYCGTAENKPTISFTIPIQFDEDTEAASFPKGGTGDNYYLRVGENYFYFSLPSLLIDYNYALETAKTFAGTSALDLRKLFRDEMYDYYARTHAISIIDAMMADASHEYIDASSLLLPSFKEGFKTEMRKLFTSSNISFTINSQNGNAIATYNEGTEEKVGNMVKSNYLIIEPCEDKYLSISTNTEMNNFKIDYRYMYL